MPQALIVVGPDWTLLTGSDPKVLLVQMRPPRLRTGLLFLARGTETPPPADAGLYLDVRETSGVADCSLDNLDPGGVGTRLWGRYKGSTATRTCPVWCSWSEECDGCDKDEEPAPITR